MRSPDRIDSILGFTISYLARFDCCADFSDDLFGRCPGTVDPCHAHFFQPRNIFIRDDPTDEDFDMFLPVGFEQFQDAVG